MNLKPCPFCGAEQIVTVRSNGQQWCSNCGAEGPDMRNNFSWQFRPTEEHLAARVAELELENARLDSDLIRREGEYEALVRRCGGTSG